MQSPFLYQDNYDMQDESMLVPLHRLPQNTSEGSEFLDDALRMEDLSFLHTEESIAAGSPRNLL